MKFKSIVVGLGQIGLGYDIDARRNIFTHTNALSAHPEFELCSGVDKSAERRRILEKIYVVPAFPTIRDAVSDNPDVVVIATPTRDHLATINDVFECCSPRVILCEKPLADNLEDAQRILGLVKKKGAELVVNYIRRFEPGAIKVGDKIRAGQLGSNINGIARYSQGLINNGSHLVNLLEFWLGQIMSVNELTLKKERARLDQYTDLLLRFDYGEVLLLANRNDTYELSEVDLLGSDGRIHYQRGGLEISWWCVGRDHYFPDTRVLCQKPEQIPSDLLRYQWHVYQHIFNFLSTTGYSLPCAGKDAFETLVHLAPWLEAANE